MTQRWSDPDAISNYFDRVLKGIGHRGSSFMDVDAITHDAATHRFLLQEFKRDGEALDKAQHWMLRDVAKLPQHWTAWVVVKRNDGLIGFAPVSPNKPLDVSAITVEEYQARYRAWWENEIYIPPPVVQTSTVAAPGRVLRELTADDIAW